MSTARYWLTATLLPNGKVLVAGGAGAGGFLSSAELYDPASGNWTSTGSMTAPRFQQTATLLANGKVLVAGGYDGSANVISSAELYDPASGTWTNAGSMSTPRLSHTATLLPNGEVLVAGGEDTNHVPLASSELYEPAGGIWTNTGLMSTTRAEHTATLLPNGKVLVAGGVGAGVSSTAELYDPANGTWTNTGSMSTPRDTATATLLSNGKVLVAGGFGPTNNFLGTAELFDVGLGFSNAWQPQISTLTSPLVLGSPLAISGSGFRGISEGSGGNGPQDSPGDHPLVQLRSFESAQTLLLSVTNWSANSLISTPVFGLPPGWTLATLFVNGIPSPSAALRVVPAATTLRLTNPSRLPGGSFQFAFTNVSGASFTALGATNLSLPLSNWSVLGAPTEVSSGQFLFTDSQTTNYPRRVYRIRSP
jgi:hypothetical protein